MEVENFDFNIPTPAMARQKLVTLLQNAHAGEKAAANAYFGHAHSMFVTSSKEKDEILQIYDDELHHRERLFEFLKQMQSQPRPVREIQMWLVGAVIAILSYIGTWFIPMYGAGKLEQSNIGEYEVAARLAYLANEQRFVNELLEFAEVEWDHELYFRQKVEAHILAKWIPLWKNPKSREQIRSSYEVFEAKHSSDIFN